MNIQQIGFKTSQIYRMLSDICRASFPNQLVHFCPYRGVQGDDPDRVVHQSDSQEAGTLLTRRDVGQTHANHICRHLLPLRVLVQLARL